MPSEAEAQPNKKPRLDGFSLSAMEEMKVRAQEANINSETLRQFQVLDEVQCSGSESENETNGNNKDQLAEEYDSSDLDLDDDEIENLLNENLPDDLKESKRPKYEERFKTVLEEKGHNHFEVLPEGWVQVTHNSGMPLFLHKKARVVSASRPYFLGAGSVRKHAIPLGAVPCLNYRRALEEERLEKLKQANLMEPNQNNATRETENECPLLEETPMDLDQNVQNAAESNDNNVIPTQTQNSIVKNVIPPAKIMTVTENTQNESLTPDQLNEYCKSLFKFKDIRVLRFNSWNARRKFTKNRKHIKNLQRPTLPDGTKLIKFPILAPSGESNQHTRGRKEWIMNPNNKSYVCILHEYVQHALKKQPTYEFKELENAATPYSATVSINNLKYGTGFGTSKKQAKSDAARETLEILIPDMKDKITGVQQDKAATKTIHKDLSVFDDIKIEDPRVAEFCNKTTEPSPHVILLTCLQRNFGLGDIQVNYEINRTKNKKNEFTMTVGKHTAKVLCKNKREGKQLASQAILQILHPHIKTWGSLLRLYGNNSIKTFKEKKMEEQEITVLQSKAAINQPNYAILDKLRTEMLKLVERNKDITLMGTFVPPNDVDLPSSSGSNLNNVDL
ncbi:microprocessor complex subunit DGCR8-like isoform X1 [Teleopsis dalmanni]|uniref:microprocessor complex subunit DGCR8-like isoform X1 n=1 Tax=Teleopsis dalmanni TaxID=139649 RepID=UPI0018CD4639|nr:microprocessor complex subunit DGCR8-like isoform X1 [Teleopsis dalmanni]XP_037948588.1 microprocessor complex subunit DGCR8-like isoform X1 [Teleopsis dalmanni]XP_037948589.1 microprocessor complex subunit DGCR8-like isoform X1 [Teleopsis dalmanni]